MTYTKGKKLLALLLALTLCFSLLPLSAFAEEPQDDGITLEEPQDPPAPEEDGEEEEETCEHAPAEAVTENVRAPGCTEPGSHDAVVYCSLCGAELSRETVEDPAVGHTPVDAEALDPTCTEPGRAAGTVCSVCGEILDGCETIEPLGHTPEDVDAVPAEPDQPGRAAGVICAVCGEVLEGCEEIEAPNAPVTANGVQSMEIASVNGNVEINARNFPDEGFRAWVKANPAGGKDYLTPEDISHATEIDLNGNDFTSLQGIRFFTGLTELLCSGASELTALDLSGLTELEMLKCSGNDAMTALDLSGCTSLRVLECSGSNYAQLARLTLDGCTALQELNCSGGRLVTLKLSNFDKLKTLYCGRNNLSMLALDGCTALKRLECESNKLITLDLSGCSALTTLRCSENKLRALTVKGCNMLETLVCSGNPLTALDCSGCSALQDLYLGDCARLQTLDCSGCSALNWLVIDGCSALQTLDCSGCAELLLLDLGDCRAAETLDCSGCIKLFGIFFGAYPAVKELNCSGCTALETLELLASPALKTLDCSGCTSLESLELAGCTALEKLDCSGCKLATLRLDGENPTVAVYDPCTALKELNCSGNTALNTLTLTGCTALEKLDCSNTALEALDLTGFPAVKELNCSGNAGLNALTLTENTALEKLDCSGTALTELNLSGYTGLEALNVSGCAALAGLNCSGCALRSLVLSDADEATALSALKTVNCSDNALTALDLGDCTGLLEFLDCSGNALSALELGTCTGLLILYCQNNRLSALDVSACVGLGNLICYNNLLTELNIVGCSALQILDCSNNRLAGLTLGSLENLMLLNCSGNSLTALDVSACPLLMASIESGRRERELNAYGVPRICFGDLFSYMLVVDESVVRGAMVPALYPPASLMLDQSYLIVATDGAKGQVRPVEMDARWADKVEWTASADGSLPDPASGEELAISVEKTLIDGVSVCEVTGKSKGTAYVVGYIPDADGTVLSFASCRVDVTENGGLDITGARLTQTAVTVQLYKAQYPRLTVIPELPQNQIVSAAGAGIVAPAAQEDHGSVMEKAAFKDAAVRERFSVRVVDDKTLEISPRPEIVTLDAAALKTLKSSYSSPIEITYVTAGGASIVVTTPSVKLTVKKALPKLSAKAVKLNSFLPGVGKAVSFSCAVKAAETDKSKSQPDWLYFDEVARSVSYTGAAEAKKSGKLYLLVQPDGWNVKMPVTVSVKAANSVPKLSIKPGAVSFNPPAFTSEGTYDYRLCKVTVNPAIYDDSSLSVVSVLSVKEGKKTVSDVLDFECFSNEVLVTLGSRAPTDGKAHTYKVTLALLRGGQPSSARTTLTVKLLAAGKISMSAKATGAMDAVVLNSRVNVTVKVKGVQDPSLNLPHEYPSGIPFDTRSDVTILKEKAGTPSVDVTDYFVIRGDGLSFSVYEDIPGTLEAGYTYTAVIRHSFGTREASCRVKLPVKFSKSAKVKPGVTLSTKGAIDTIRPGSGVTVTPVLKNSQAYSPDRGDLHIWQVKGKTLTEVTDSFDISVKNGAFFVQLKPDADHGLYKYRVSLSAQVLALNDAREIIELPVNSARVSLPVKQGSVKLTKSAKSVTLVKADFNSRAVVTLRTADTSLAPIDWERTKNAIVSPKGTGKQPFYTLIPLSDSSFAIGYAGGSFKSAKGGTVKIPVYFEGGSKASATISVKVKLQESKPNISFPNP